MYPVTYQFINRSFTEYHHHRCRVKS